MNVKDAVKELHVLQKKQQSLRKCKSHFLYAGMSEQISAIDARIEALTVAIIGTSAQATRHDVDMDILVDRFIKGLNNGDVAKKYGVTYKYVARLVSAAYQMHITNNKEPL